ncbi:hypothetical protein GALMADRAFT_239326 [Galerina marginata CBS 339.88]|uniref:5'-Nucleotidase C-terminal domain-containing protein n=1 Tax=Galerina marginata (strain CBS 339.88) TaxID=685588 RepID=A0A067TNI7_GALM3|nr:hypothetical protein GALMADRAFT_239326 [Galerina marginata CBS 339.88]
MASITLPILHFNDVYRVTPQKVASRSSGTIDVTQFAALADDLRSQWTHRPDGKRDGLLLFSGDVFSPSVESSVTRGSHMVPVLNELGIDVSVTGNHDFDFGYPHLAKIIDDTNFPWLLSNIVDTTTSRVPGHLHEYRVIEKAGVRIGFIGLVEKEWIATVSSWPPEFVYKPMKETGLELSRILRDPNGEHRCDLVIALTHSRLPNDIKLAKELFALSPSAQETLPIISEHGVDIVLGGHDHIYFVGRGVTSWENFNIEGEVLGAESDNGDVLVIKSGSDFRDLSEISLRLTSTPKHSIRRMVISEIIGRRHTIEPGYRSSITMTNLLKDLLGSVSSALKAPVCKTAVLLDVRSSYIRVQESPVTNWFADIARHAYDDALCMRGNEGSDGVLFCAGTFRGDSMYGPGLVTIGDILEILPFEDPIIVVEVDGAALWDALESSLSTWPAQEGRFPTLSGFRVSWDSQREPGNRILGIWHLTLVVQPQGMKGRSPQFKEEPVKRESQGRTYKIVTREYMAQGHDGFTALTRGKVLLDDECGAMLSTIVRKYLLGSQFVNRMIRLKDNHELHFLRDKTNVTINDLEEEAKDVAEGDHKAAAVNLWKHAASLAIHRARSKFHYQNHFKISETEHMSPVDAFDGVNARRGFECKEISTKEDEDLLVVSPEVDGRLRDEAKASDDG